ncbi:MAG TPA: CHAP domain-containing protein [Polyangiaceae bacterium LLY-WYZ-15_(1-7)]|nr:hypothetical protein [Myxococcales bacterium]MAT23884.1 hypothetical protein [Sandaracinus sp.]HJK95391.1 CHAP domain-containing protein [Polyangiaceae bacterium LLY-WYZ-15_(1-7)]MBJ71173.1 hypothetical protein [Sandaracinus sp.]HJL00544.1 CHAP domain-containing protein [Polyangiaceae bacterium LLY-WYZ-15_(1-7)]
MRSSVLLSGALLVALLPSAAGRAADPCRGVDCGAGRCMVEDARPFCFCDEGHHAEDLRCLALRHRPWRRQRAGAEVVRLARAEVGRSLEAVGGEREAYPGPLAPYVPGGDLWCSDFVSWIYRAAGAPLSGGYEGGWLVPSNQALRRWFVRRGLWVDRRDPGFADFTPRPGDYVRIVGNRWGHSALVERVEGDTLFLVEGNSGRRVRSTRTRHFRTRRRIDGFGIASLTHRRRRPLALPRRLGAARLWW